MEIRTLDELLACAPRTVVLTGNGVVWQLGEYESDTWFTPGSGIKANAGLLIQAAPLRVIYEPEISPTRVRHEYGIEAARAETVRIAADDSPKETIMTAHDRYRPTIELESGNHLYALDCADCRNWEGWPGVRVWTAPEHAAVDLADLIRAADTHERAVHPTGCRCDPYDCNHDEED